ncbi:MAG: transporter substrate-binding domain-containing protein [Eubacterium sp.]|nr:transporter substrate-binding domain-containing protein [Eubacterium sp.]
MKNLKKTAISLLLAAALGFTACKEATPSNPDREEVDAAANGSSSDAGTSATDADIPTKLDSIKESGKIQVYCDPNFPPFEYIKGDGPAGVDIDIANAIAGDLGVEAVINNADFDAIIMSLATGIGDIAISGMTITEERQQEVDFSVPYIKSVQYLLVAAGSEISSMEDLAGKKVGAVIGYTGNFVLDDSLDTSAESDYAGIIADTGVENIIVNSASEGGLEVINGNIDALIIDEYVAKTIAAENDGLEALMLVYDDGKEISEEYGVAIPKGNDDLVAQINSTIERLVNEGKIEEWVVAHSS